MTSTKSEAAAAVSIGAGLALRKRDELLGLLRPCFARTEPWLQAGKYLSALASELPRVNGWSIARRGGDRTPDRTQRLLNHASWDTFAAMSVVRRFAVAGLDQAARRRRRRGALVIGAIDETGQEKAWPGNLRGQAAVPGMRGEGGQRDQHRAPGLRAGKDRAYADRRPAVDSPRADRGPGGSPGHGTAAGSGVPYQGAACHRHQHGCRRRRDPAGLLLRERGLRQLHPAARALRSHRPGVRAARAVELHPHPGRGHQNDLRRGGHGAAAAQTALGGPLWGHGSKGERWYAWAWLATASPRHHLLIRRHLKTGELAFHYCHVPEGQLLTKTRLIRAAGLRWPVEEDFALGKDCFGLDQCQARLYTAILRHVVLVMTALAICAIAAAHLKDRTDTQAPPPVRPGQPPPAEPGMIPLTIPEIKRLLAALTTRPLPRRLVIHWDAWTRRHQARARWFHKRARLARQPEFAQVKL